MKNRARMTTECIALLALAFSFGCATSVRPLEQRELQRLYDEGVEVSEDKNKWIAGALGLAGPACNLYLAWGTGRDEQLTMALINAATWPLSAAWAIPGCALDAKSVNELATLEALLEDSVN